RRTSELTGGRIHPSCAAPFKLTKHAPAARSNELLGCILKGSLIRTLNRPSFEVTIDVKEIFVDAMTSRVLSRKSFWFDVFAEVDMTVHAPLAITHYFYAGEFIMIKCDVTGEVTFDVRRCHDTGVPDVEFPTQPISIFNLGTEHVEIEESVVPIEVEMISFMAIVEAKHRESPFINCATQRPKLTGCGRMPFNLIARKIDESQAIPLRLNELLDGADGNRISE